MYIACLTNQLQISIEFQFGRNIYYCNLPQLFLSDYWAITKRSDGFTTWVLIRHKSCRQPILISYTEWQFMARPHYLVDNVLFNLLYTEPSPCFIQRHMLTCGLYVCLDQWPYRPGCVGVGTWIIEIIAVNSIRYHYSLSPFNIINNGSWEWKLRLNSTQELLFNSVLCSSPWLSYQPFPIASLGIYSVSGKTSNRQISWSMADARLRVILIASIWNS